MFKIPDKMIKVRITRYLNKYNIISDSQYGFRANMSTADAVIGSKQFFTDALEKYDTFSIV